MEELEQRVWQRVLGPAEEVPLELRTLIRESWQLAAGFAMLAQKAGEDTKPLLKKLRQAEQRNGNILVGICRMEGSRVPERGFPAPREPAAGLLAKSYHSCLHLRREYLARSAAGEYAQVFRYLADRAGEQCAGILQLLGML